MNNGMEKCARSHIFLHNTIDITLPSPYIARVRDVSNSQTHTYQMHGGCCSMGFLWVPKV